MPASPLQGSEEPVAIEITSGGARLEDTVSVLSVTVHSGMNRVPEALIVLADTSVADPEFPLTDGSHFVPGAAIIVRAGYGSDTGSTLFQGVVVSLRLRIDERGLPRLEVGCRHKVFALTLGRRNRVHSTMSDSALISTLIEGAGLSGDVAATSAEHPELVQYACSDWDFILARAEVCGMVLWAGPDGTVTVRAPDHAGTPGLGVSYGIDLIEFEGELDARCQFAKVSVSGWDIATQATATGSATPLSESTWGNLTGGTLAEVGGLDDFAIGSAAPLASEGLQDIAKARQARAELARLRGRVRFQGSALATVGGTLELKGLGERFSGTAVVCSLLHRIEDGAWITEAGLGLDPNWQSDRRSLDAPGAAGLTAPARGLNVGKVTQLDQDPSGQHMVQVSLPLLGSEAKLWARLGGPYCTADAGVMFRPEIGDEVVIGFFNDDPSHAVVLGSLHSSQNAPPSPASKQNFIKTILTREKVKIEFDDEKKTLTLATPGGNTVVLDDDQKSVKIADQNGNSVLLGSAGITLDSAGDVTIKAAKGVSVQAQADVALAGINVKADGQMSFKASGQASAEVTAAGQLKLQGALVMIN